MDLITQSDQLNTVFESSEELRQLYQLTITYYSDESIKSVLREKKDIPPLIDRAIKADEPLKAILSDVPIMDPKAEYQRIFRCLDLILYSTAEYTPFLNEKNGPNLAIAHPVSMWLYKEHRSIETIYSVGMHLFRLVGKRDIPIALVRLPELIERFRAFVLPYMIKNHEVAIEQLKKIKPDYMNLGMNL